MAPQGELTGARLREWPSNLPGAPQRSGFPSSPVTPARPSVKQPEKGIHI
jgi:hypothetical protein